MEPQLPAARLSSRHLTSQRRHRVQGARPLYCCLAPSQHSDRSDRPSASQPESAAASGCPAPPPAAPQPTAPLPPTDLYSDSPAHSEPVPRPAQLAPRYLAARSTYSLPPIPASAPRELTSYQTN